MKVWFCHLKPWVLSQCSSRFSYLGFSDGFNVDSREIKMSTWPKPKLKEAKLGSGTPSKPQGSSQPDPWRFAQPHLLCRGVEGLCPTCSGSGCIFTVQALGVQVWIQPLKQMKRSCNSNGTVKGFRNFPQWHLYSKINLPAQLITSQASVCPCVRRMCSARLTVVIN